MSEKTRRAERGYQRAILEPVDEHGNQLRKDVVFSCRMAERDRDLIAVMAAELGMSQSALVTRKVLGKMSDQLEIRVLRIEKRIARLERKSYGITLSDEEIDQMMSEGT